MGKILVTGGAGYIGSHTAKVLFQAGFTPVVIDNLVYGHEDAVLWGPLIKAEISDSDVVAKICKEHNIKACIHFAAYAYVGESVTDPAKYYQNNVAGTLGLLDGLRQAGVDNIVFSSTCATYGIPENVPIDEETPQSPVNPYGHSKLMMEQILSDYSHAYGLRNVCLRYFNAAGSDPELEIGERHDPETHLIPLILDAAAGIRNHITVYGTDYATPDGTCIRDYIHVLDLAAAHVQALNYLAQGGVSSKINLGYGKGYSVKEVIDVCKKVTGKDFKVEFGARRDGDPPKLIASNQKAKTVLGWQPQYDDLTAIIQNAWDYHCKVNG